MKQNSIDFSLLKDFFHSKLNRGILGLSLLLLLSIFIYLLCIPAFEVFPARKDLNFVFYSDSINGGHSVILQKKISDKGLVMDFELKEGFTSPYVGISISKKSDKGLDLSLYHELCIELEGEKVNGIAVTLFTANPQAVSHSKDLCFNTKFGISSSRNTYKIGLDQLKTPDWWYDYNNISPDLKINPDWAHIYNINIGSAYTSLQDAKHSLLIHRIWFERNDKASILFLSLCELILIVLLAIVHYLKALRAKKKTEPIRIEYKSVEIKDEHEKITFNGFINYINSNYQDTELSLELVAAKTGINQRHITKYIHDTFDCNFKTYVNRIRIHESKRLLAKKDLNIGEIAFKVGFSNQSHFNRVFKISEGMSPSEFREGKK